MITKVGNIAQKIYDRHLLKQTLIFINELNNQEVDQQKIDKYMKELKSDSKKASEELGRVLLLSTVQKGDLMVAPGQSNLNLSALGKTFCQHWMYHNNT